MTAMRILWLGANGQVGHALRTALPPLGEVIATTRDGASLDDMATLACDLSIAGSAAAIVERVAPDLVVNAAAFTAVDQAEAEPQLAQQINAYAVAELAQACARRMIPLIHYSTDYVFDGQANAPYLPQHATAPLGVYGMSKLAGEEAIRTSGARHLILRTAWVYGLHGHNFLKTMLRLGGERDELRVVADQIGSPTPAWLIAQVTARIVEQGVGLGGTHHLVADGRTSWHGFAQAIMQDAHAAGLLARVPVVHAIASSEYPTPAKRPAWSVLDTDSLRATYAVALPDWRDALRQTLRGS